jgi:molybdopterin synthase catalytic subunit
MAVRLFAEPFDPWALVRERERELPLEKLGATSVFVGRMRDFNDDRPYRACSWNITRA